MKLLALSTLALALPLYGQLATGTSGMVSSAHPLASEAGLAVLKDGGNAFDAAIAVAATLNVVEPENSGLGGYGSIAIYDAAKNRVRVLNASGRIPKGMRRDAFDDTSARRGVKTIAAPVNARAWEQISQQYGTRPWKTLFSAAILHAEQGFPLVRPIAEGVFAEFPDHAKAIYGRDGKPLGAGEMLVQRDLGKSLRLVAEQGVDVLHGGELGRKVADELARAGSFVTLEDIAQSGPEWIEPISMEYRGHRIYTAAPPLNSFAALVRLGLLSRWKLKANSAAYWHHWAEALKHGEWCRLRYAVDPDFGTVPLDRLLSARYWKEQAARVDPGKASEFVPPGAARPEGADTTHFVVADRWGNVVTMTQTLGNGFGSRLLIPGTGIWLNNSLAYSTFDPPGNPMDVHPGRRKLNSNAPAIVMKNGRPWIALGAAGGHTIHQTVPLVLARMIDDGLDMAQALDAPRIAFVADTKALSVESRLDEAIRRDLEARGHKVEVRAIGRLHGLTVEWRGGKPVRFTGAPDPRGSGLAAGY
ncbi:MAG: gamma-glutamyltransferase family protein [Bryobacterales bacterium]|nr:gamma-glutamyltransferase family protein [Bryobacterales bacterium]